MLLKVKDMTIFKPAFPGMVENKMKRLKIIMEIETLKTMRLCSHSLIVLFLIDRVDLVYGNPKVRTRKTAIWARVTGCSGQ